MEAKFTDWPLGKLKFKACEAPAEFCAPKRFAFKACVTEPADDAPKDPEGPWALNAWAWALPAELPNPNWLL